MTKRELVLESLNHKRSYKLPYHVGLTKDVENRLIRELGEDFIDKMGNYLFYMDNGSFTLLENNRELDAFGVVWLKDQKGDFGVVDEYQLQEPSLDNYTFPAPSKDSIHKTCNTIMTKGKDHFRMFSIGFSLFERAWSLRRMENLLMDFILEPAFVEELFEKIVDYNISVMDIAMEYPLDGIYFGDDWGQQKGLIMGPDYWRKYIKPALARMYGHAKKRGLYICQHSCGDISDILPDLIQIGLDIYNTVQPEIYDLKNLKREYGDSLTFFGGISTQTLLPFATPEEVKRETRIIMDILGENGGYIVAPTHAIPDDVSTKNILALLEVVQAHSC